jgi:hypothetical protein
VFPLTINNINALFYINRKTNWNITIPYVAKEFNNVPGTGGCGYILFDYVYQFKESDQKVWSNFVPKNRSLIAICTSIQNFISDSTDDSFTTLSAKLENIISSESEHLHTDNWLSNFEFLLLLTKLNINYAYFEGRRRNSPLKLTAYITRNKSDATCFMSNRSL